jgi:hypothetical protein
MIPLSHADPILPDGTSKCCFQLSTGNLMRHHFFHLLCIRYPYSFLVIVRTLNSVPVSAVDSLSREVIDFLETTLGCVSFWLMELGRFLLLFIFLAPF